MQYDPYTDLVIKSQPYYPKRRITEVRIPLPLKEIEYSDKPFGTTELEPQYAISYVDTFLWEEHERRGTTQELINRLQDAHYRKLGIKTTLEKAIDDEKERLKELQDIQRKKG